MAIKPKLTEFIKQLATLEAQDDFGEFEIVFLSPGATGRSTWQTVATGSCNANPNERRVFIHLVERPA
jgi:hypothetical protein